MINRIFIKNSSMMIEKESINEVIVLECFVWLKYGFSLFLNMHYNIYLARAEISTTRYRAPESHFVCGCISVLK